MKWTTDTGWDARLLVDGIGDECLEATASDIIAALRANPEAMADVLAGIRDEFYDALSRRALAAEKARDALSDTLSKVVEARVDAEEENAALREVVEAARKAYEAMYRVDFTTDPARWDELGIARMRLSDTLARLDARDATAQDKTPGGAEESRYKLEWGEAHYRLTTLTDKLLGSAPTMPLLDLVARLEKATEGGLLRATENDEPTGGLSPEQRAEVEAIVREVVLMAALKGSRRNSMIRQMSELEKLAEAITSVEREK